MLTTEATEERLRRTITELHKERRQCKRYKSQLDDIAKAKLGGDSLDKTNTKSQMIGHEGYL